MIELEMVFAFGPVIGAALIGAAGGLAGGLIDRGTAKAGQSAQASFNERMYRNRYQWQMEDMRAAGLNPILSYKQGAPSGPGIGGVSSNIAGAVAGGVSSGLAARRLKEEVELIGAQAARERATEVRELSQAQLNRSQDYNLDIIGRGIMMDNLMKAPEAFAAEQLMGLIQNMGEAGEASMLTRRLAQMMGVQPRDLVRMARIFAANRLRGGRGR